jgi:hypothetical protein
MMKISQAIEYEGRHINVQQLADKLRTFHECHPFATGLDWAAQEYWAVMTDEDALVFCLQHPEYKDKFKKIKDKQNGKT